MTKGELEQILTKGLGLADPEYHLERAGTKFSGNVISSTFKGRRDHERQKMIWDALEAELGAESGRVVGMLLAYTPQEWELGKEAWGAGKKRKKAG